MIRIISKVLKYWSEIQASIAIVRTLEVLLKTLRSDHLITENDFTSICTMTYMREELC